MTGGSSGFTEEDLLQAGYRYALALTHDPQDAEDLVQEGWLRLYRKYGEVSLLPLLYTTIRHLFLDQRLRKTRVRFVSLDDLEEAEIEDVPLRGAGSPSVRIDLERLLADLKVKEREVLFFHYVHGCTAKEIGRLTGQPRGTVLSLLQRSKKKLRAAYDERPRREESSRSNES